MNKYTGKSLQKLGEEIKKFEGKNELDFISNPELINDAADLMEAMAYELLKSSDELRETKSLLEESNINLVGFMLLKIIENMLDK